MSEERDGLSKKWQQRRAKAVAREKLPPTEDVCACACVCLDA